MSIVMPVRSRASAGIASVGRTFFNSPQPAGRKITAGFTFLQRIGKTGCYDVWFPKELRRELEARQAQGLQIGPEQFSSEWAAVRQFELLHEMGNYHVYDFNSDRFHSYRAFRDFTRFMRAGGLRLTVATLGSYVGDDDGDELEILDQRLQEGIAQMIHMLYLEEASEQANTEMDARLAASTWDYRQDLPHVGMVLGAGDVFRRYTATAGARSEGAHKHKLARQFFDILNKLPQNHMVHDTAMGLQLPELIGENQWLYIPESDETFSSFNRLLTSIFEKLDKVSLGKLHGREDAGDEIKGTIGHMRGYGDRLSNSDDFYRSASSFLNNLALA